MDERMDEQVAHGTATWVLRIMGKGHHGGVLLGMSLSISNPCVPLCSIAKFK
jgi:hypothetical protein